VFLVLLGPPGSGKGTQASRLAAKFGLKHISTGDILRNAIKEETGLGLRVKAFLDRGELVPDAVMLELIRQTLADCGQSGFVFDGFPRTIEQAAGLDQILAEAGNRVEKALNLQVSDQEIIKRLSGRFFCPRCQRTYNYPANLPKHDGRCDDCGVALQKRADDTEDVVKNRLEVYKRQTEPLIRYYQNKSILRNVDGTRDIETVFAELSALTLH